MLLMLLAAALTVPTDLTAPGPTAVVATGLAPNESVTLSVARRDAGRTSVSRARFVADGDGRIDTGRDAPIDGDYRGVSSTGPFWSAHAPADGEAAPPAPTGDGARVTLTRSDGSSLTADAVTAPTGVTVTPVDAFPAALLARPAAPGRYPVIILLGGSEGGSYFAARYAPIIAARGYAVLGLPYYAPPWTPEARLGTLPASFTDIPVDRLEAVRAWLRRQPGVDADRIGLYGVSKGAEFALIAASRLPWVKATVAIVPTDVVWAGWGRPGPDTASFAWHGKPLPFVPYADIARELAKVARGERMDLRRAHDEGRAANPDRLAPARIRVEAIRGPLLVAGGDDDRIWPSGSMTRAIAGARGRRPTVALTWLRAGHALAGPGTEPTAPMTALGGDAGVLGPARTQIWQESFRLFDAALKR